VDFEKVILVDSNDNAIGVMEKMEAHKKALLHRAVSVFIFNSKQQMLLQKRALNKYHSPGLWTNAACTHPYTEESNMDAALRRLKQEMGLETNLIKIFHFIYKEKLDNGLTELILYGSLKLLKECWPIMIRSNCKHGIIPEKQNCSKRSKKIYNNFLYSRICGFFDSSFEKHFYTLNTISFIVMCLFIGRISQSL